MITALLLWAAALAGGITLWRREPAALRRGLTNALGSMRTILPILVLALPTAGFLIEIVPRRFATVLFGPETGVAGHLMATLVGAAIPGGPFVSFPVVLALWQSGAGPAQMVTLISAWSVLGLNRVVIWELPLMGWRFVVLRLLTSFWLPPASGLLAEVLLRVLPLPPIGR